MERKGNRRKIMDYLMMAYDRVFRRRTRRTIWGQKFGGEWTLSTVGSHRGRLQVSPESFREQFEAAYPDAAKFLNLICRVESVEDAFLLKSSFVSTGFIASRGLSTAYREWESKHLERRGNVLDHMRYDKELNAIVFDCNIFADTRKKYVPRNEARTDD